MTDVTALGELLIDFIPAADSTPEQPVLKAMAGGAPGNFAAAVQAFGQNAALISKVGRDAFGDQLVNTFEALGVETRGIVRDEGVFTTMAFITLDAHGERSFSFARKPGADTCLKPEECAFDLVDEAKLFHFGTLSLTHQPARSATMAAVAHAKARGKLVSFDPNLRPPLWNNMEDAKRAMLWGLEQADLVKISDNEVEFLFGCGAQEGAAHVLTQYGARLVLVTMGGEGCWCLCQRRRTGIRAKGISCGHHRRGGHLLWRGGEPSAQIGQGSGGTDRAGTACHCILRLRGSQFVYGKARRHCQHPG